VGQKPFSTILQANGTSRAGKLLVRRFAYNLLHRDTATSVW
jgi:hypothetical protein